MGPQASEGRETEVRGTRGLDSWIILCAVPAIALAVAARQVYLSRTEDLSTWKGGGLGIFAAAITLSPGAVWSAFTRIGYGLLFGVIAIASVVVARIAVDDDES